MTKDDKIAHLRLIRTPFIGPATYDHLIADSGSPQAALDRIIAGDIPSKRRLTPPSKSDISKELDALEKIGGQMLLRHEEAYPELLKEIPQAPISLSCLGNLDALRGEHIAIVGARNASHAGLRMAEKLASELSSKGYKIVSGLARGVDTVAHQHSLTNGTLAILAGGIDRIYPLENTQLYQHITKQGLILSEMPLGHEPQARLFPRRNRIIAGLCRITIVIESSLKSGSGITANFAADFGREVGSVPGSPLDTRNLGTLRLIKDGAHVITSTEDVIDILHGLDNQTLNTPQAVYYPQPITESDPQQVLRIKDWIKDYIGVTACPIADLFLDIPEPEGIILACLAELELEGKILRHWDNRISAS